MVRYNERTIEEKLNYIKICDLVVEYIKEEQNKFLEKLNNIDEDLDTKEKNKQKREIKAEIKRTEDLEKHYSDTRKKIIIELTKDEGFIEYKNKYLNNFTI